MKTLQIVDIRVTAVRLTKNADGAWQMSMDGEELDQDGAVVRPVSHFETVPDALQKDVDKVIGAGLRAFKKENGIVGRAPAKKKSTAANASKSVAIAKKSVKAAVKHARK